MKHLKNFETNMKYLKRFNESKFSSVVQDIDDMCLDLKDEYINTEVIYDDESSTLQVNFGGSNILWSSISEYIDRVISYLEVENWDLVDMFLEGNEVIYPEQTIEKLNKIPKYTLDSVSFIFTEKEKSGDLIKSKEELMKQFTDAAMRRVKRVKRN